MYSKKDENQIRNLERDSFRKLKKEENKNKNVPISDDILYISDFILERFPNSGDSGDLYLATSKHNPKEKYILKHEYYDCACNEYMYSKVGNKMGIKIVPVKLFVLDDRENITMGAKIRDGKILGTPYLLVIGDKTDGTTFELENIKTGEIYSVSTNELIEKLKNL